MLKPLHLLAIMLLILGSSFTGTIQAQKYADKSFYLIDSLDLSTLTESNVQKLDSCLTVYHQTEHDTVKIDALKAILSNLNNYWDGYDRIHYKLINKAIASYKKEEVPRSLKQALGDYYGYLGNRSSRIGNKPKALEYYLKEIEIAEEIDDKLVMPMTFHGIAHIYQNLGENSKALEYLLKALKISEEIDHKLLISNSCNELSNFYSRFGNNAMAIKYALKALKISENPEVDKTVHSKALYHIGTIYRIQKDDPKALEYFHKAQKSFELNGNKLWTAACLLQIGLITSGQGDYVTALETFEKAIKLNEESNYTSGIASSIECIGSVYSNQGDHTKALEYFDKASKLRKEINDRSGIAYTSIALGKIKMKLGDLNAAKNNLSSGLKIAQELGRLDLMSRASQAYSKLAKLQGKPALALEMYELHILMRDSINNEENLKATIQQQFKFDYEKKELMQKAEEERLALEQIQIDKEKQAVLDRKQAIQVAGICVFIVVFISILLMLSKKKVNPKVLKFLGTFSVLILFEFITVVLHPTITHITHHDLLLTLMCTVALASLVVPMHHKVEHYLVGKLVKKREEAIIEVSPILEDEKAEIADEDENLETKDDAEDTVESKEVKNDIEDEKEN